MYSIELKPDCNLIFDSESEEAKVQNLVLNLLSGLSENDLTDEEKALLDKFQGERKL